MSKIKLQFVSCTLAKVLSNTQHSQKSWNSISLGQQKIISVLIIQGRLEFYMLSYLIKWPEK